YPLRLPPSSTLFPYTTLFRSIYTLFKKYLYICPPTIARRGSNIGHSLHSVNLFFNWNDYTFQNCFGTGSCIIGSYLYCGGSNIRDRKSTRLNSSHVKISYAVF